MSAFGVNAKYIPRSGLTRGLARAVESSLFLLLGKPEFIIHFSLKMVPPIDRSPVEDVVTGISEHKLCEMAQVRSSHAAR